MQCAAYGSPPLSAGKAWLQRVTPWLMHMKTSMKNRKNMPKHMQNSMALPPLQRRLLQELHATQQRTTAFLPPTAPQAGPSVLEHSWLEPFRISTPPHGTMSYLSGSLVCRDVPAAAYWARSAQDLEKVRENLLNFKAAVPKRRYYTRPVGLEFFISCAFLGIRIPSSMWEQRCGNRQSSKAAVYSRYDKA